MIYLIALIQIGEPPIKFQLKIRYSLVNYKGNITKKKLQEIHDLSTLNWICYAPTHYNPKEMIYPSFESIQNDLIMLKESGFDGIITYECSGSWLKIPEIAEDVGLKVIQGIWGPANRKELERAVEKKDLVTAYCIGNEGLGMRYSLNELDEGATYIANRTELPVAISEQIHMYFQQPELVGIGDWIFPIVHPHFGNAKTFESAINWIEENTLRLKQLAEMRNQNRMIFIKEIGMPSAGDASYNEENQAKFLDYMLHHKKFRFALFEAFDRTGWEYISPVEPYWGIYHQDRSPKPAAKVTKKILMDEKKSTIITKK